MPEQKWLFLAPAVLVAAGYLAAPGEPDAENAASIRLHESVGFVQVGRLHEVGFKFGRRLDWMFLQCILSATER